jgi:hypothetical protein
VISVWLAGLLVVAFNAGGVAGRYLLARERKRER